MNPSVDNFDASKTQRQLVISAHPAVLTPYRSTINIGKFMVMLGNLGMLANSLKCSSPI